MYNFLKHIVKLLKLGHFWNSQTGLSRCTGRDDTWHISALELGMERIFNKEKVDWVTFFHMSCDWCLSVTACRLQAVSIKFIAAVRICGILVQNYWLMKRFQYVQVGDETKTDPDCYSVVLSLVTN